MTLSHERFVCGQLNKASKDLLQQQESKINVSQIVAQIKTQPAPFPYLPALFSVSCSCYCSGSCSCSCSSSTNCQVIALSAIESWPAHNERENTYVVQIWKPPTEKTWAKTLWATKKRKKNMKSWFAPRWLSLTKYSYTTPAEIAL